MDKPILTPDNVEEIADKRFLRIYDLHYRPESHYYLATRRPKADIMAVKSEDEFKKALPDAVSVIVILKIKGEEPKLLLAYEFRYPAGQFLISPPAGLMDPEDALTNDPIASTAVREVFEETGIRVTENDRVFTVNPLAFSTPGMTDESNALACVVVERDDFSELTQEGAEGQELFSGFFLATKEDARRMIKNGRDDRGIFYSLFTWCALTFFASDMWKDEELWRKD